MKEAKIDMPTVLFLLAPYLVAGCFYVRDLGEKGYPRTIEAAGHAEDVQTERIT